MRIHDATCGRCPFQPEIVEGECRGEPHACKACDAVDPRPDDRSRESRCDRHDERDECEEARAVGEAVEETEQKDRNQRQRTHGPDLADDAVDVGAGVRAFPLREQPREQVSDDGDQKPRKAPRRSEAGLVEPVVQQRDAHGRVAPDEEWAPRVAFHTAARIADHACDQFHAFVRVECFVLQRVRCIR